MTSDSFHWFVLAGGLSPYTLDLWERVAARSDHSVTLAHVPRDYEIDFAHEGELTQRQCGGGCPCRVADGQSSN